MDPEVRHEESAAAPASSADLSPELLRNGEGPDANPTQGSPAPGPRRGSGTPPIPLGDLERRDWLIQVLGEPLARGLGLYKIPESLVLSVVIPVYNEVHTLAELLRRVRSSPVRKQIILVDDQSSDGTTELLRGWVESQPDLTIVFHDRNRGKGAALRTGFAHATGEIVIVQDADLEYDPAEYPRLMQPIVEGTADAVFGSRFIGESHRVHYYWHSLANKFLTCLSNMFTNLNLTDMEVCYKLFRKEVVAGLAPRLKSDRFGFEPEMTARVARFRMPAVPGRNPERPCRVHEMPVSYNGRSYEEGKKIGMKDGFQALWCIVRYGIAD